MKRVAAEIASKEPRIDVLINNAGAMFATRQLTEDGLEYTFALNHMAYFVVTEGLRERLSRAAAESLTQLRPPIGKPGWISTICNWPKVLDP